MTVQDDRIAALQDQVQDLIRLVDMLSAAPPAPAAPPPPPPPPARWAARASPGEWSDLMDWVDALNTSYSLFGDFPVLPCWPAHPGVIEELAGLWRAWTFAALTDMIGALDGSTELSTWHDKALWPTLHRLEKAHYRSSSCRDRHVPDRAAVPLTDRFIVP